MTHFHLTLIIPLFKWQLNERAQTFRRAGRLLVKKLLSRSMIWTVQISWILSIKVRGGAICVVVGACWHAKIDIWRKHGGSDGGWRHNSRLVIADEERAQLLGCIAVAAVKLLVEQIWWTSVLLIDSATTSTHYDRRLLIDKQRRGITGGGGCGAR